VFIKGKEGTNHHSSILNGDSDSEVYPLQKFASLCSHKIIIERESKKDESLYKAIILILL
jgi:hypothetical protein